MLPGDLVVRLAWLAEHDRCALVQLLRTVDPRALGLAMKLGPCRLPPSRDPARLRSGQERTERRLPE